jgi:Linalool dehydratase/isomerase
LAEAQVALIQRAQQKTVWGYWYWQNLLGNWDFIKRRADPIDLPQNIMFSGYLNLQIAMFRQATGDARFDRDESLVFDWSPRQRFSFNHQQLNDILIRNFNQDLCLWPCEPVLSRGRRRGFVFPYCNTVTAAGIAIMDTINGTDYGAKIAHNIESMLAREYTQATNDLAAFMVSGLGLSVRQVMSGTGSTAGVVAFIAPLRPELAWRAWEILKREWLETGEFRKAGSTGQETPDWSTGAKTNAETLAAAMHLAHTVGDEYWHAELWDAAATELRFFGNGESEGVAKFGAASVHANGMLGMGGMTRLYAFNDMLTKPRPPEWQCGPRLTDAPHPNALVSKAVSDGHGLDLVLRPGIINQRVGLRLDRLQPGCDYIAHGAVDSLVLADAAGIAQIAVDIENRTEVLVRPA